MPVAALDNWQPVWNALVSISTPVCVNFELRPGAGDIHICWFDFDALAQGNAYKPTKEPMNYRGPGGDRTHDLQTEATPPAASCPARTLHATEIAQKRNSNDMPVAALDNWQPVWNALVSISTPGCGNLVWSFISIDKLGLWYGYVMTSSLLYPSLAVKYLHSNKNELVQLLPHPHCV